MRGGDHEPDAMFSYVSMEDRIPPDHPLRAMRGLIDTALREMSPRFTLLYAKTGRPSIAPEKLLRAQLLQILYTIRSERLLMEQLDYNLLFRWFVELSMDDTVWDATVFTKNRERLLAGDVARALLEQVVAEARARHLLSSEHFSVDGTLIEAWARLKSFQRKDAPAGPSPDDALSQRLRMRIEEIFGWLKTVGLLRKTRHRGTARVEWMFVFSLAVYNLVRMRNLAAQSG